MVVFFESEAVKSLGVGVAENAKAAHLRWHSVGKKLRPYLIYRDKALILLELAIGIEPTTV